MWADPDRQTGSIAEKTSNHPTEKFRTAAQLRVRVNETEGGETTADCLVRGKVGCAAYLFALPLPLSENKHVLVI